MAFSILLQILYMKFIYAIGISLISLFSFSQVTPELFLAELTKQFPNVRDFTLSPNGKEILFTAQSVMGNLSAIVSVKKENNIWSQPEIASFSGMHFDLEPYFASNGLTLYFVSSRPLDQSQIQQKDFDIWFVERATLDAAWSEPKNIGSPINTEDGEFYPSIANNGDFYFTRDNPDLKTKDDIYKSVYENNRYQKPKKLPMSINTEGYEYNAFIAPDASYIIFGSYNRKDGFGSGDLYISFQTEDGWTPAENLGANINSNKMDYCPFVDTKTNTLYFTSKRDHTKVQQEKALTTEEFISELHKADNGSSRLYQVSIDALLKQ